MGGHGINAFGSVVPQDTGRSCCAAEIFCQVHSCGIRGRSELASTCLLDDLIGACDRINARSLRCRQSKWSTCLIGTSAGLAPLKIRFMRAERRQFTLLSNDVEIGASRQTSVEEARHC